MGKQQIAALAGELELGLLEPIARLGGKTEDPLARRPLGHKLLQEIGHLLPAGPHGLGQG